VPDKLRRAKLTADQKVEVLSYLALGFKPQFIADHIFDTYGIEVTRDNIYQNYSKNPHYKKCIKRLRKIQEERIADIPLATKRGRLAALQKAFNEAMTWRTDKLYFDKDGGFNGKVEKRMIGIIASLVNEARIEMGGIPSAGATGSAEVFFIELLKKRQKDLENGEGFRITRIEHRALDRFIQK